MVQGNVSYSVSKDQTYFVVTKIDRIRKKVHVALCTKDKVISRHVLKKGLGLIVEIPK